MVVLGIDPGLANTGYGVVARRAGRLLALDGGVVVTPPRLPLERRLASIAERVRELLGEHDCDEMALEELYFGENAQSAFAVGHARGAAMLAAGEREVSCASYTPQQVKAAVCGNGRAAKDQVARMVQALLALPQTPTPDHASDALAVAICHLNGAPLADAVAQAGARGGDPTAQIPPRGPRRARTRSATSAAAAAQASRGGARTTAIAEPVP